MRAASERIRDLLKAKRPKESSDAYTKDLHSPLLEIDADLDRLEAIVGEVYQKGQLEARDSAQIKRSLNHAITQAYSFTQRLGQFLSRHGLEKAMIGPNDRLQKILNARGNDVHVEAPSFFYTVGDDARPCEEDSTAEPYSGECEEIDVEYVDKNGTVKYQSKLSVMVSCLRREVTLLVTKLVERIEAIL